MAGATLRLLRGHAARWLEVGPYLALYALGATVYAGPRPDPRPAVFGYHEVFHLLVIAAVAAHYATVAGFVLPRL